MPRSPLARYDTGPRGQLAPHRPNNNRHLGFVRNLATGVRSGVKAYRVVNKMLKKYKKQKTHSSKGRFKEDVHMGTTQQKGITTASTKIVLHPHKSPKNIGSGTYRMKIDYAGSVAQVAGLQAVQDLFSVASLSQLATSSGVAYNAVQSEIGLIQMNPSRNTTGGGIVASQVPLQDAIYLKNVRVNIQFSNWTSVPNDCILYMYVSKGSTTNRPSDQWSRELLNAQMGLAAEVRPPAGTSAGTGGLPDSSYPLSRPYECLNFKKYYRVAKQHEFKLESGANQEFNFDIEVNKRVSLDQIVRLQTDGQAYWNGNSVHFMLVARGAVIKDTTALGTRQTTWSGVDIGYIATVCYDAKQLLDSQGKTNLMYGSLQTPISVALANQSTINIVDTIAAVTQV